MRYKTIFIICTLFFLSSRESLTAQTSDTFHYVSDTFQTWTVPGCVNLITVTVEGARGGLAKYCISYYKDYGQGGIVVGTLSVTPGEILYLYVGSEGTNGITSSPGAAGGWNGGGRGAYYLGSYGGGGGGGASDIRVGGTALSNRVVVAGGGGGEAYNYGCGTESGGRGGTDTAECGYEDYAEICGYINNHVFYGPGGGGSQLSGGLYGSYPGYCNAFSGSFGIGGAGGSCTNNDGGGGGGGYYGGGGGVWGGGGGGSSYVGGLTSLITDSLGGRIGNGLIIITYTGGVPILTLDTSFINPTCGFCNGNASVTVSGGSTPYTYLWAPTGQTNATATGLCANTYTITVSDSCGDVSTASVVLTALPLSVTATVTAQNKCNGNCNGSATAIVGLATSPYTYSWSPSGGNKATATSLCAGNYTITITDKNGCTGTAGVTITQPALLKDSIVNLTYPLCNGAVTGSASAIASGGISPYTYKWSSVNQTTATATGLSAGVYTLTVTDSNACTTTTTAIITQPTQVAATFTITNVLCNGGVGSAMVNASGGVSPYTYLWTPTNQTTATATGLSAGAYTIKVSDSNGCTLTNALTLTQPAVLTATMGSPNNIRCYGGTGSVTVKTAGGTIPYTYLWTPSSETNATATGLFAGSYTVTITDAHHCTASATVTMTQPSLVGAKITASKDISCMNGSDGSATVTGSGGTTPYTYLWNPGGNTNATATGLFALSYTAMVTDNNGCTATASINLTEPTQVTASISEPRIICKDSTGILIATANGGTAPYQYKWSSGATNGIATITPIATNDYSVIVTDSHGCTASANIILQYGPAFAVDITGKKSVCVGDSTEICANAIGAIDGVFYQWAPPNSTNECIEVSPGIASVYTVTVVDGCGSTTTAETNIVTEPSPVVNMDVNFSQGCVPFCAQFINQSTLSKGKVAQYVWDFGLASGESDTSRERNPIYCYKTAGQYNVSLTVISDSGCSATLKKINMVTIYNPPKAAFTYSPNPLSILSPTVMFNDESKDFNGNNVIYWTWDFGDRSDSINNQQNPAHTYQDTGTYCVNLTVMSPEGCTDTTTNCLIIEPDFKLYIPSAFTPNGDGINEVFKPVGQYIKTFEMYIFNRWGEQIFHTTDLNSGWNGEVNGTGQISPEDVYIYKIMVTDAENRQHSYVGNVTLLK